ncbi:hypothetical protein H6A12_12940 [Phocea massiliensis]|uniref:Uncharacterized protein n=1 Tax=Merdimmobilis hominis TaxID=2897707 RepID=A0A938X8U3_9FIRM|nr:hypothetical protein [Merdimmobilis hominis]MBM6922043.1 hypothetical protein [Merdimmobilis hominis]
MTKQEKRNLAIIAVVLSVALAFAVCVSAYFPRKTIGDLLCLTSKNQITKNQITSVTLVSFYRMLGDAVGTEEQQQKIHSAHKDITGTPLAQQYIDAIFEKPVVLQDVKYTGFVGMGQNYLTTANVYITVTNVGDDFPITERDFIISCNSDLELCNVPEVFLYNNYTADYRSKHEEVPPEQLYVFTVPDDELFTSGFIKKQLGVNK